MVNSELLAKRIGEAIGAAHVRRGTVRPTGADGASDGTGAQGVVPAGSSPIVARPGTVEEVSTVFRLAREAGAKVRIRGGGTGDHVGSPGEPPDLVIETLRLNRVLEYEPGDLIAIAEGGVTLAALRSVTEPQGQRLPLDPPHPDRATLGGVFASARTGPRRLRGGTPRDLVLGMKVVLPDGTISRSGGRVVKNVAGYGLHRLWTGSFGTLALIAEVSMRLAPVPERARLLGFRLRSPADAEDLTRALFECPVEPAALELLDARLLPAEHLPAGLLRAGIVPPAPLSPEPRTAEPDGALLVAVHYEGFREEVDLGCESARRAAGDPVLDLAGVEAENFLQEIANATLVPGHEDAFLFRASLLPGRLASWAADAARRLGERGVDLRIHAHLGTGVANLHVPRGAAVEHSAMALAGLAREAGGTYRIDGLAPAVARDVPCWGGNEGAIPLSRRLKAALDPDGTLAPGRFAGRI